MPRQPRIPKVKITKRTLDALRAGTLRVDGKPVPLPQDGVFYLRDTEQKGFGVRVTPNGAIAFIYERRYRSPDGRSKSKRWTLGRFGELTVEQARGKALELANQVARGEDPDAAQKAAELGARTLRQALDEYLRTRDLKPRTRADMEKVLGRYLADWFDRPMTEITRDHVLERYLELADRVPGQANLAFRYLRTVFGFAQGAWRAPNGERVIRENPVRALSELRVWRKLKPRRTVIEPHELAPWFEAVLADPDPRARDFFQFVILTGARRGEALGLTWDRVDLEGGKVLFTDTKARRDHVLPLGPYLWELLKRRRQQAGEPWVFSDRDGTRLDNLRYSLGRIQKASGVTFTVHDLRRTFATVAESLDLSAYAVKKLLNHALPKDDVTAGYVRLTPERLRDAIERIETRILTLAGIKGGAEVIRFPGGERSAGG